MAQINLNPDKAWNKMLIWNAIKAQVEDLELSLGGSRKENQNEVSGQIKGKEAI